MKKDTLHRFIFENMPVRGILVQLNDTWKSLQGRKNYPDPLQLYLGEFVAANALLAATLKLEGSLIMQIQGDGPVHFMVMECTSDNHLRGLAKYKEPITSDTLQDLFGDGRLAITIDNQKSGERYQSIVSLEGNSIKLALESHLKQSEQLETVLFLATDQNNACGLLLQKLPGEFDANEDDWNRVTQLASTIKNEELFSLSAEQIIHRLFNEDDVRLLDSENYLFKCTCSRERVANMLVTLGQDEVKDIIREQGSIDIDCEFCNEHYSFDEVDSKELFATTFHHPTSKTQH